MCKIRNLIIKREDFKSILIFKKIIFDIAILSLFNFIVYSTQCVVRINQDEDKRYIKILY